MSIFISFEGGEGSGKSTQSQLLWERLRNKGLPVILVKEPGSTPLGEGLRFWLKREDTSHVAELFLFAAARAELVERVIKPTLKEKKIVISDRYADSTVAYQGYGRRIDLKSIGVVNRLATQGVLPDLTFLMDCPPEVGLTRVGDVKMRLALEPTDEGQAGKLVHGKSRRFEKEALAFHRRVRTGYLKMASSDPTRWHIVDGTKSVEEASEEIWKGVLGLLAQAKSATPPTSALHDPNSSPR